MAKRCTKPKMRSGNFGTSAGIKLKYRVTGAGISKSDYTRKLEARSDLTQRRIIYKKKCGR